MFPLSGYRIPKSRLRRPLPDCCPMVSAGPRDATMLWPVRPAMLSVLKRNVSG
ncbi:hypothetical protein CSIRO_2171 [Bradyrhizobiaceae bacterium SG-6C]|nr:hypothetical protein CSIRO_2171 [Bradyrhizobiaceae bacterium SG-6C]